VTPFEMRRMAIARAHGWPSWDEVVRDSQRDGYTENGGRGAVAAAIARRAGYAGALIELLQQYDPPCSRCRGTGKTKRMLARGITDGFIDVEEPCPLCEGAEDSEASEGTSRQPRHIGCVVRESSTCMWLADGTKVSTKREPTATGRMWLEHVPTPMVRVQGTDSDG